MGVPSFKILVLSLTKYLVLIFFRAQIELIDFGATREYSKSFMDDWLRILRAAVAGDREACVKWSRKVGYLTGEESTVSAVP